MNHWNPNPKNLPLIALSEKFGLENVEIWIPPGWNKLVNQLLLDLLEEGSFKLETITIIKEKHNMLAVHSMNDRITNKAYKLIRDAESESLKICQDCGTVKTDPKRLEIDYSIWSFVHPKCRFCDPEEFDENAPNIIGYYPSI